MDLLVRDAIDRTDGTAADTDLDREAPTGDTADTVDLTAYGDEDYQHSGYDR